MKIYIYDKDTKEFLYSTDAQENPKKSGEYLYPKSSTTIIPPQQEEYKTAVFNGEFWDIVPDYRRAKVIDLNTLETVEIKTLGKLKSDYMLYSDYILTDEYKNRFKEQEKQDRINNILAEMSVLDGKRIRAVCEPSVKETESGETWLDYYNSQMDRLRQDLEEVRYDT
jgi:hypothetical protein